MFLAMAEGFTITVSEQVIILTLIIATATIMIVFFKPWQRIKLMAVHIGNKTLAPNRVELMEHLSIDDHNEISSILQKHSFPETHYYEFGTALGLGNNEIRISESDYRDDTHRRFDEILMKWLRKSECTWEKIIKALNKIKLTSIAVEIDKEKQPACVIFDKHILKLNDAIQLSQSELLKVIRNFVWSEKITSYFRNSSNILDAVKEAVYKDYQNLKKFAHVLKKFTATVTIGDDIMNEYRETFPDEVECFSCDSENKVIQILQRKISDFDEIRIKRTNTLFEIEKTIANSDKDKLQSFLRMYRPDLKPELSKCQSIREIFELIGERCSLFHISLLKGVVMHFNNDRAKKCLADYKEHLDKFCESVPSLLQCGELFSSPSLLKCTRITFCVDRNIDDYTFKDIKELITIAFEQHSEQVQVVVIKKGNSFTLTCSFSLSLSESLITSALENIEILKGKGVYQLTIGYYTVYSQEKKSSITTIGMMKQMLVSKSVQLVNQEWELATLNEKLSVTKEEKLKHNDEVKRLQEEKELLDQQLSLFRTLTEKEVTIEEGSSQQEDPLWKIQKRKMALEIDDLKKQLQKQTNELRSAQQVVEEKDNEIQEAQTSTEDFETKLNSKDKDIEKLESIIRERDNSIRATEEYSQQAISSSIRLPTLNNDWDQPHVHAVPVQIEMTSFQTYKKDNEYWYSPGFLSHVGGYKMCLCIQANGDNSAKGKYMSLYVHLMVGKNDDRLEWPFQGTVRIEILNRKSDKDHHDQEIHFDNSNPDAFQWRPINGIRIESGIAAHRGQGGVEFIPHDTLLYNKSTQIEYLKDNSIKIQVKEVIVYSRGIPTVPAPLPSDNNSVLTFEISDFARHKSSNSERISKPFYSHTNRGYKFALFVYPNGRGGKYNGKYISVFVHLMKGEYDSGLNFPFRGTLIVQILNVLDNKGHVERPVSFSESTDPNGKYGAQVAGITTWFSSGRSFEGYGFHDMLPHKYLEKNELHNTQYLRNDTLTLRITKIDAENLPSEYRV